MSPANTGTASHTQIGVVCFTCDVCWMSGTVSGLRIAWGLKKTA